MKRILNKAAVILMTFCIVFTSAVLVMPGQSSSAYAASIRRAKPSISSKTVKLYTGKTRTIKIYKANAKVKWSSTNKKIAYVKTKSGKRHQKVVIKAGKKTGTCYIKAKIGRKTLKCKVTVKKKKNTAVKPVIIEEGDTGQTEVEIKPLSDSSVDLSATLTGKDPEETFAPYQEMSHEFVTGVSSFSIELLQKTIARDRADGKTGNTLISPESVMTALAMVENGAAGQTLTEMEETLSGGVSAADFNGYLGALNYGLMKSDRMIYSVANSIWAKKDDVTVRDDFLQTNKDLHDAEFYAAPFDTDTVSDMNTWVYNKSRNMIDKIIDELSKDARMVLINTIAFEGKWENPFEKTQIKDEQFTCADGTVKTVSMLKDTETYPYLELNGGKGFAKHYQASRLAGARNIAFVGILPPEGMTADEYIDSIDGYSFIKSWNTRKSTKVSLSLPKFSYDYSSSMGDTLQDMGIVTAFTNDADFSGMIVPTPDTPALKISKVLHKTHIDLDENGTKAAAATAVVMEKAGISMEDPTVLTFDRPFVYAIVDTLTGIPLFIGEVNSIE